MQVVKSQAEDTTPAQHWVLRLSSEPPTSIDIQRNNKSYFSRGWRGDRGGETGADVTNGRHRSGTRQTGHRAGTRSGAPWPSRVAGREAPSYTSRPFPNLRSWRKGVGAISDNKEREESPYLSLRAPRRTARHPEGGGRCGGSAARTRAPEPSRRPAGVDEGQPRRPRRPRARR